MHYDYIAIPDAEIPSAVDPTFQHVVTTYASETNKTASVWRAVPDALLDFKPHDKTNPIRTILVAGEATVAAVCREAGGLVADRGAVLRGTIPAADLELLAAGVAHCPPPYTGADLAAPGRYGSADHLRSFRRYKG
jgi:hypothetical protein